MANTKKVKIKGRKMPPEEVQERLKLYGGSRTQRIPKKRDIRFTSTARAAERGRFALCG